MNYTAKKGLSFFFVFSLLFFVACTFQTTGQAVAKTKQSSCATREDLTAAKQEILNAIQTMQVSSSAQQQQETSPSETPLCYGKPEKESEAGAKIGDKKEDGPCAARILQAGKHIDSLKQDVCIRVHKGFVIAQINVNGEKKTVIDPHWTKPQAESGNLVMHSLALTECPEYATTTNVQSAGDLSREDAWQCAREYIDGVAEKIMKGELPESSGFYPYCVKSK